MKPTTEELVKLLRGCIIDGVICCDACKFLTDEKLACTDRLIIAAADRLEELEAELAALKERQRWISVEERLPEPFTGVICFCPARNNMYEAYVDTRCVWRFFDESPTGEIVRDKITHWMPLPEPPKEDEK